MGSSAGITLAFLARQNKRQSKVNTKLIGYPSAAIPWHIASRLKLNGWSWSEGTGAGTGAPSRSSWGILPPDVADIGATVNTGDITGASGTKRKRARAVGVGVDPDMARADKFDRWLSAADVVERAFDKARAKGGAIIGCKWVSIDAADFEELLNCQKDMDALRDSRAGIVADVLAESEQGQRILTLAGGKQWGTGTGARAVHMDDGGGMAAKAARSITRMRGSRPSDTSLEEAAAAAAAKMWFEWQCYSALCGDDWTREAIIHLARYGWRAAFHSLTRDGAQGLTGRMAAQTKQSGSVSVSLDHVDQDTQGRDVLPCDKQALADWARDRQSRIFDAGRDDVAIQRRQRRGVLGWIAGVLDLRARNGNTRNGERARFSVLVRLVHGRDIATAAKLAGFASGRAALESFRAGFVWQRLRAAIGARVTPTERKLRAMRLRAVRSAMAAMKLQRQARVGAGRAQVLPSVARAVVVASGTARAVRHLGVTRILRPASRRVIVTRGLAGRSAVHPLACQWAQATEQRAQAVAMARAARVEIKRVRAQRSADFEAGTKGLRAGWLR